LVAVAVGRPAELTGLAAARGDAAAALVTVDEVRSSRGGIAVAAGWRVAVVDVGDVAHGVVGEPPTVVLRVDGARHEVVLARDVVVERRLGAACTGTRGAVRFCQRSDVVLVVDGHRADTGTHAGDGADLIVGRVRLVDLVR
jgi:hypothetical protein